MYFDTQQRFIFCSQSDPEANKILQSHGFPPLPPLAEDGQDGSVLLLSADGQLMDKSRAPLHALKLLGFPFNIIGQIGLMIPNKLRDVVYDAIAVRRYAMFGKKSTCRIPTAKERQSFLHTTKNKSN